MRHRTDNTQADIVAALRKIGCQVWIIGRPCDLLTFYRNRWLPLECKSSARRRKDQPAQDQFLAETGCPRVTSAEQAIAAVSSINDR